MTDDTTTDQTAQAQAGDATPDLPEAVTADLDAARAHLIGQLPEKVRALAPSGGSIADLIKWIGAASEAGITNAKPVVPATDTGKPKTSPTDADLSSLPPTARMARAYGNKTA